MSKNLLVVTILALGFFASTFAQSPDAFNYQALVRDAAGLVLPHAQVSFRITLHTPADPSRPAYTETHHATTDAFGRLALRIGNGKPVTGTFADLDWSGGRYEIQVELDTRGGHDFELLGSTPLLSVPLAFHARRVEFDQVDDADADPKNEIQHLRLSGDTLHITQGNYVVLPAAMTGSPEDGQTLSLDGATLSISDGNSVNLGNLKETDFQLSRADDNYCTKVLTIEGRQTGNGSYAQIVFENEDIPIQYLGREPYDAAMISSSNNGGSNGGDLRFHTTTDIDVQTQQHMIITPEGRFGFGINSPAYSFDVVQNVGNGFISRFKNTLNSNSSYAHGILVQAGHDSYSGGSSQSAFVQFEKPDGEYCGRIKQDGGSSVEYYSASDRRLKENIHDTHYGLDDLLRIQVRDYNYIVDGPEQQRTGFIAQELYEVYPIAVDKGGEDVQTEPWSVDYGQLTPLLVQAIQDRQKIIEAQLEVNKAQQEKLDAQESELNALRKVANQVKRLEAGIQALETTGLDKATPNSK